MSPYLSPREAELSALILGGFTNRQIAAKMGISLQVVKNMCSRIYLKGHPQRSQT